MLEHGLQPILQELRGESLDRAGRYQVAKNWFTTHPENLAANPKDFIYLCRLPTPQRKVVTFPVIGNWFLDKLKQFEPTSPLQTYSHLLLKHLVSEKRFNNEHTHDLYGTERGLVFNRRNDRLNGLMLQDPDQANALADYLRAITLDVATVVDQERAEGEGNYTSDLGHGIAGPAMDFDHLVFSSRILKEMEEAKPLDLNIMVVDDTHAEQWYQRMLLTGFKDQPPGQQGAFTDCESALKALERDRYDVVLTDLQLGDGKMDGIEFVERGHEIQLRKGVDPLFSVFSFDNEALEEAEQKLRRQHLDRKDKPLIFQQVSHNNKARFTAANFRVDVSYELKNRRWQRSRAGR